MGGGLGNFAEYDVVFFSHPIPRQEFVFNFIFGTDYFSFAFREYGGCSHLFYRVVVHIFFFAALYRCSFFFFFFFYSPKPSLPQQ